MNKEINLTGNAYNKEDSEKDLYPQFESNLKEFFNKAIDGEKKLFKTNVSDLFDTYLNNLPEEARAHYTCNGCKHFINRFGGLVTIDEDGTMKSAMWDVENTPKFFVPAVAAMKEAVLNAKVKGVFIPESQVLGIPKTGEWTHLSVKLPGTMVNRSVLHTAHQLMAEKLEDFKMLTNALLDYSAETVDQALALINSESMYRSDRVLGVANWFKNLIEKRDNASRSVQKTNIVWLAVATAPAGFTHIRSSMIGTLLDDIASGMSSRLVATRFAEKMNPANYMRSQSAPTANAIIEAEKIVEKLGIANSLERRYATYEEIPNYLWENKGESKVKEAKVGGVFGHLTPKAKAADRMDLPSTVMTWDKFQRTILPTAESIEALVDNPNRFMALITAADETAPNILQWDNTFSWYYHAGVDGEIKKRVEAAGGRYENNEIRVSLSWENYTDLDIHCKTPSGEHIYYGDKRSRCGGWLDVDANGGGAHTTTPVENIRWANNAPNGRYRFYVHNFAERGTGKTPFKVEMEVRGKTWTYNGVSGSTGWQVDVFEFDYFNGEVTQIRHAAITSDESWTAQTNTFVKVNGITTSPNLWGNEPQLNAGNHTFFLLDGVKDESEGLGRGFFNEHLKSDLRQIRKTLEAYTASVPIGGAENASACGLGYSKDNEWNLTLKVTSNNSTRIIKIDRWD